MPFGIDYYIYWMISSNSINSLLVGATISPTDAAAVLSILRLKKTWI